MSAAHPLAGRRKTRTHRERIRASQLARYQRIRKALGVASLRDLPCNPTR